MEQRLQISSYFPIDKRIKLVKLSILFIVRNKIDRYYQNIQRLMY